MASSTLQNAAPRTAGSLLAPPATPRVPRAQNVTGTYQTPQRRSNGSNVSSAAKRKLSAVACCPERCLVTGAPEPYEICHVVPKATPLFTLFRLEQSWDPRKCAELDALKFPHKLGPDDSFVINLNTTRNLIYLTPNMHTLFDRNQWALIPTNDIMEEIMFRWHLKQYHGFNMYPERQDCTFHFVPLDYTLTFLQFGLDNRPVASHLHPFTDLPIIRSHIHPYFAIYNAGQKVAALGVSAIGSLSIPQDLKIILLQCETVYRRWIKPKTKKKQIGNSNPPTGPSPGPSGLTPRSSNAPGTSHSPTSGSQAPKTRSQTHSEKMSPNSNSHGQTKRCAIGLRPRATSLPTPEESQYASTRRRSSERSVPSPCDSMARIQDWVAATRSAYNLDDPNDSGDDPCLDRYSREPSRDPLISSWHAWKPSWTLSRRSDLYDNMDLSDSSSFAGYYSDSGCRYDVLLVGRTPVYIDS